MSKSAIQSRDDPWRVAGSSEYWSWSFHGGSGRGAVPRVAGPDERGEVPMRVVGSRWWWGTPCCRGSVVVAAGRSLLLPVGPCCCRSVLVAAGPSLLLPVGVVAAGPSLVAAGPSLLLPVRPCCCRSVLVAAGRCRCCSYRAGVENERQRELAKGSKKEARRSERGGRSRIAARRGPGAASTSGNSRIAARRGPGAASAAGGLTWRAGLDVACWTGRGVLGFDVARWTGRGGRYIKRHVQIDAPQENSVRHAESPWRKGAVGRGAQTRISSASSHHRGAGRCRGGRGRLGGALRHASRRPLSTHHGGAGGYRHPQDLPHRRPGPWPGPRDGRY